MIAIRDALLRSRIRWVSVAAPDTRELLIDDDVSWIDELDANSLRELPYAVVRSYRDLRRRRPDAIASAGSGIAVPYFIAARALGIPAIWVETYNMVEGIGRSARICSALARTVLVQRTERLERYRRARFVGAMY